MEARNPNVDIDLDRPLENPRRWIQATQENCDQFIFADVLNIALWDIEENPVPQRQLSRIGLLPTILLVPINHHTDQIWLRSSILSVDLLISYKRKFTENRQ